MSSLGARSGRGGTRKTNGLNPARGVDQMVRRGAGRFLFQTIHDVELMLDRERAGREASPSAAVIDGQSVMAVSAWAQ